MKRTVQVNIFKIAFIILKRLIRLTKNRKQGFKTKTSTVSVAFETIAHVVSTIKSIERVATRDT